MKILGIESSCDETAAAVLDGETVLSSVVYSQTTEHRKYGGVVPEIASRAHVEKISTVVDDAIEKANININEIDLIASTAGPGLIGALAVGFSYAKGLALSIQKPFMGIHHIEAHLLVNSISKDIPLPYVALIVSGGHTEIIHVKEDFSYSLWSKTRDDAAGEAFDKIGKMLGFEYPAGKTIGETAIGGNKKFLELPQPLKNKKDFSFSGLKTAVYYQLKDRSDDWINSNINDICASVQEAIVRSLVDKTVMAVKELSCKNVVIAGGVAANKRLREKLEEHSSKFNFNWYAPPLQYCTDNGLMVAAAANHIHKHFGITKSYEDIFPSMEWYNKYN